MQLRCEQWQALWTEHGSLGALDVQGPVRGNGMLAAGEGWWLVAGESLDCLLPHPHPHPPAARGLDFIL